MDFTFFSNINQKTNRSKKKETVTKKKQKINQYELILLVFL